MKTTGIRRLSSWSLCLAFLITGTGCGGGGNGPTGPQVIHNLQISRFTTTPLDNARADAILADMSTILQTSDGAGDVACNVGFTRNGDVTAFATGTGMINSQADFTAVNGLPGQVKVVNQINWCGGLAPNIIGCAPVPGPSMVVVRFTANQEGILWVHEFGHNKGLSHRNGNDLVMNPVIGSTKRQVNEDECNAYRQQPATALLR